MEGQKLHAQHHGNGDSGDHHPRITRQTTIVLGDSGLPLEMFILRFNKTKLCSCGSIVSLYDLARGPQHGHKKLHLCAMRRIIELLIAASVFLTAVVAGGARPYHSIKGTYIIGGIN